MEPNAFIGKKEKPTDAELTAALGKSKKLWDQLVDALAELAPTQEWNSYSIKAGWALKLKKKDRTILYLAPCAGSFRASFALGDKAIKIAQKTALPKEILKLIKEAKKYAEGTAVRLDVNSATDVIVIKQLAAIKAAN